MAEFVDDAGVDGLGGSDVTFGSARIALFLFRKSAPVKRIGEARIDLQGSVVSIDRRSEFAELEIAEGTAVQRVGVARPVLERLVAVCESFPRVADNGSRYAPRVERRSVFRIELDRPIKVWQGTCVIMPVEIQIAACIGVAIAAGIETQ